LTHRPRLSPSHAAMSASADFPAARTSEGEKPPVPSFASGTVAEDHDALAAPALGKDQDVDAPANVAEDDEDRYLSGRKLVIVFTCVLACWMRRPVAEVCTVACCWPSFLSRWTRRL
jgi:hypothetical protein